MKKDEFARELMLGEMNRENGRFVTTRIIDRLMLMYAPLFERDYLSRMAELLNVELRGGSPLPGLATALNR
jgi:hypothetical protein